MKEIRHERFRRAYEKLIELRMKLGECVYTVIKERIAVVKLGMLGCECVFPICKGEKVCIVC